MRFVPWLGLVALLLLGPAPVRGSGRTHVVAPGQTLSGIADRYSVSVPALCAANGITEDRPLQVGQALKVPAPTRAPAKPAPPGIRTHVVAEGHTLGKIAARYHVGIEALCTANDLSRREVLRVGQVLWIPSPGDKSGAETAQARRASVKPSRPADGPPSQVESAPAASPRGLQTLAVPGAGTAYYFEPQGPGRMSLRPVIFYLHGRGGSPRDDCIRWAPVAQRHGWLVCPTGPENRGGGWGWANNWPSGRRVILRTLEELRSKYGRRVQLYGNTLVGFSEGAYVAMNVGVREPRTFNRWLLLGGTPAYWGVLGTSALERNRKRIRRVYLITGAQDTVVSGTREVQERLKGAGIPVRLATPDFGHEVPLGDSPRMYEAALEWLQG